MKGLLVQLKRKILKFYMKRELKKEYTYVDGDNKVKYLFVENKQSDKLMIVFSGFPSQGKLPGYNYFLKFKNIKCNKLFILDDFGKDIRGSYYLGQDGDFFVARLVTKLIEKISTEKSIDKKDIITVGSSKGGFAALYFALKNSYGAVIAGEPQILLGNYLALPVHSAVYKSIIGDVNENNTEIMNKLLFNLIDNKKQLPYMYLHCGKNGYHDIEHLSHLVTELRANSVKFTLDMGDYGSHDDVGKYFPKFAIDSILKELTN